MKIEKLKQARSSRSWEMFVNSPTIREFAPDIKTVSVKVQMVFNSAVCEPIIKEYKRALNPHDKLYLHYDCANNDCTGYGFDLTQILRQAISSRKIIRGKIYCTGKEDWKYLNASGCTCHTTLYYELEPNF